MPLISGNALASSATVKFVSSTKVSGYEVSSSSKLEGPYTLVYDGKKTSYTFTALKIGSQLYVKVRSYLIKGTKKTYSAEASIRFDLVLAGLVLKGSSSKGINTLSWSKVAGATSYELSSATSYSGTYKFLTNVNTTSYKHRIGLKKSQYYKVRAFTTVNGTKVYGPYSSIIFLQS